MLGVGFGVGSGCRHIGLSVTDRNMHTEGGDTKRRGRDVFGFHL